MLGWIPTLPSLSQHSSLLALFGALQGHFRGSGELATAPHQRKILLFIWGRVNPSDQGITCVFGWLSNAFLLQHEGHFPSASLGSSVSMVQHKVSSSTEFCVSELSVCEQDGGCSF